ncbi:MAG: CoA-acylating methylmalonate-semialdehyde dehydrogenase, partial [Acidiferrobacterales bacterium]
MDVKVTDTLHHYVGGQKMEGASGRFGDVYNPATGEVTARVPFASADEVRQAIGTAAKAFPDWAATPPAQRAQILYRFRDLVRQHINELAELLSSEHGKTLADAKGSLTRGIEVVEFACGIPQLLKGEFNESVSRGVDSYSMRQPLGVCGGITPFNFPAMVPMWMFPIALACGNTFVLKPSEKDPSVTLRLGELASEAGLPDGVLNVVNGDKEAVDTLLTDPEVASISFVGSVGVGEYIYTTGSAHGKRVQALCGAKNHMVVMPDADMDQTVDAIMGAAYGSAGERCMAISVVVPVGEHTADDLIERLKPRVRDLKIGPYTDPEAEMGPLVTPQHHEKVKGYVDLGVKEGAELVVDGRDLKVQGHGSGCFLGGCLFDKVRPEMRVYKEEIFGPVLSVVRADNYDEAVKLVNDHELGNGAAVFTRDGDCARDFTSSVKIGMVGVNVPIPVPVAYHSFGGWKRSLFG